MRADFGGPVDHRPPDFLTVVEAGAVLRFSRGKAYELAREFLATGGASGMPAIRLGRQLRVPRALLEQRIGGPITWPFPITQPTEPVAIASPVASKPSRSHATRPPVRRYDDQSVRGFDVTASVPLCRTRHKFRSRCRCCSLSATGTFAARWSPLPTRWLRYVSSRRGWMCNGSGVERLC